jgi:hypothetical protein
MPDDAVVANGPALVAIDELDGSQRRVGRMPLWAGRKGDRSQNNGGDHCADSHMKSFTRDAESGAQSNSQ